jgi:tetratricopeptide (TPR) repeat protein
VAERPDDAYAWYQLGKDHDVYQRPESALACFAKARACLPAGAPVPAWLHDLVVRRLHAAQLAGRHSEAAAEAESQLAQWQGSPDFFFALGNLLLDWAATEPALARELLPMIEAAWQRCLAIGEQPGLEGAVAGRGSHLAAHNLAVFYEQLGRPADAAAARAIATVPN